MTNLKMLSLKVLSTVLASAALFTGCNNTDTGIQGTGAEIPKFDIASKELPESEGLTFVQNLKIGWNLGNTLDANQKTSVETASETSWGAPVTTVDMIKAVKKAGFNTLRLPVTWHNHVDKDNKIAEEWLKRVKEVVDYGYKNGMYVILNIHHDTDLKYFYPSYDKLEQSKKFVTDIWTQLSEEFKDYDEHLIFECMNEPRLIGTNNEWWVDVNSDLAKEAIDCIVQTNQAFVDLVRASGGKNAERYLMVPSYCASPDFACCNLFTLPKDSANKIIVSAHSYEPYDFALSDNMSNKNFSERSGGSITNKMEALYDKFVSKGIPVVIGEFGSRNKGENTEARVQHAAFYAATAKAHGITCVWWDNNAFSGNGELFGLYNRSENTWTYPDIVLALMENS
ncbi:MAG TPA: endoglucanase [Ruminococcaceae bacterium]|nr:endoglucanase [Oscillospiraceae bacterium]